MANSYWVNCLPRDFVNAAFLLFRKYAYFRGKITIALQVLFALSGMLVIHRVSLKELLK